MSMFSYQRLENITKEEEEVTEDNDMVTYF